MGIEVISSGGGGGRRWGTWEELLLGGAVLRHGTRDWSIVASELRARTSLAFFIFTPEECKAKYEDLQQRYAGCTGAWFEVLRKQRMEELRLALELSDDSIGSLETKLATLKSEKAAPFIKSEDLSESLSKENSKDGLSAGSFTQENQTKTVSTEEMEVKPEKILTVDDDNKLVASSYVGTTTTKKRRGIRKRKECHNNSSKDAKQGSVGETCWCNESLILTQNSGEECGSSSGQEFLSKDGNEDLFGLFSFVLEHKSTSVFRHRLNSQKRGRYKKLIRQHKDFGSIRSRIASRAILTHKELYRDLLLLANNALVFYSKTTHEHKSALLLRDFVMKLLQQYSHSCKRNFGVTGSKIPATCKQVVKPRTVHSGNNNRKRSMGKVVVANCKNVLVLGSSPSTVESLTVKKRGVRRASIVGRGMVDNQVSSTAIAPLKGRKRIRSR